jgi:plasmid stability protein
MEAAMGRILVRNISDAALETLREKAKARGQSLEALVRQLIEKEGASDREALIARFREIRKFTPGVLEPMSSDEYREGLE